MKHIASLSATLTLSLILASCSGGTPTPAPAGVITPQANPLEMTAQVGATTSQTFTFSNTGGSDLKYELSVKYPEGKPSGWLTLSGAAVSGTLAASKQQTVTVNTTCQPWANAYAATLVAKDLTNNTVKEVPLVLNCTAEANTPDNAPVLTIDPLTESSTGSVTIKGKTSDNVMVHRVTYRLNNGAETRVAGIDSAKSFDLNFIVPGLQAGENVITITAYDSSNVATPVTRVVTYTPAAAPDTINPHISDATLTQENEGYAITALVMADDNTGITKFSYRIDDGSTVDVPANGGSTHTLNLGDVHIGAHTLHVTAYDAASNSFTFSKTFTVADVTQPEVSDATITQLEGTYAVSASIAASDNEGVTKLTFSVNGGKATEQNVEGTGPYTLSLGDLDAGDHTLQVTAYDAAGNATKVVFQKTFAVKSVFVPDTTGPVMKDEDITVTPGNGTITIVVGGNETINHIKYVIKDSNDSEVATGSDDSAPFTAPNGELLKPGTYTVIVTAYDDAGNPSNPITKTFTVADYIAPTFEAKDVTITAPKGVVSVTVNASEPIKDTTYVIKDANGNTVDELPLLPGTYTVVITVKDAAGNPSEPVTVDLTVADYIAPTVSSTDFKITDAKGVLSVKLVDNADVARFTFTVDGNAYNGEALLPGEYTVAITAFDAHENAAEPVTVTHTVADYIAPTVSVSTDKTSLTAAGSVKITATAADNLGVTKVEFYRAMNGGTPELLSTLANAPFEYTDTLSSNGSYTYTAIAYDAAGLAGTSTPAPVTVELDVTAPVITGFVATQNGNSANANVTANIDENVSMQSIVLSYTDIYGKAQQVQISLPSGFKKGAVSTTIGGVTVGTKITLTAKDNADNVAISTTNVVR